MFCGIEMESLSGHGENLSPSDNTAPCLSVSHSLKNIKNMMDSVLPLETPYHLIFFIF